MNPVPLFIALVFYTLAREVIFWVTTQRLINKIMSRNYHEFQMAEKASKLEETPPSRSDLDPNEDFGRLSDLG